MSKVTVGVLALQGDVLEHLERIRDLGLEPKKVLVPGDLDDVTALLLPGGESTAITKLLQFSKLYDPLRMSIARGLPIWGTCAGMVLLSQYVISKGCLDFNPLGIVPVLVERNAFGSQVDSFEKKIQIKEITSLDDLYRAVFIRAPRIVRWSDEVSVMATIDWDNRESVHQTKQKQFNLNNLDLLIPDWMKTNQKYSAVMVRYRKILITSFHPEITSDNRIHEYFLSEIVGL